jgi:hypothetical protein
MPLLLLDVMQAVRLGGVEGGSGLHQLCSFIHSASEAGQAKAPGRCPASTAPCGPCSKRCISTERWYRGRSGRRGAVLDGNDGPSRGGIFAVQIGRVWSGAAVWTEDTHSIAKINGSVSDRLRSERESLVRQLERLFLTSNATVSRAGERKRKNESRHG